MADKSIPQPNARTFSLVDVVAEVHRGRIRIPDFQRPLRWQWEDVRRLFDSIIKGYPIGSLLLWQRKAPADRLTLGALSIQAEEFSDAWWVVDGQQRLVSLANVVRDEGAADDRFALAYDLSRGEFRRPSKTDDGFIVPLPAIFDLQRLFRWVFEHKEVEEKLDDASRITKAIREFTIPAYVVEQQDEATLRDIFDRMNNSGKRLSRAEVFSALHPSKSMESLQKIVVSIDRECGFGEVDEDTVLHAVLARRGPDVTRDIHVEFSPDARGSRDFVGESASAAYREGEAAQVRAVRFLQNDVGVPHFSLLPYRYLLVVLARFFAHFPDPDPRNRTLLRRWFWRAALLGTRVFRGGYTGMTRDLAQRIRAGDETGSVERLLGDPLTEKLPRPNLARFHLSAADSRVVLCALWSLGPRSFVSGQEFDRQELSEAIRDSGTIAQVATRLVPRGPTTHRALAANRMFWLDANPPNGDLLPRTSDVALRERVLCSHALSLELVDLYATGQVEAFLDGRQEVMEGVVRSFLDRMAETAFEDTPPLDSFDLDEDENAPLDGT